MARGKRVTIKDVAREAGLAFSTVSNALAGKSIVRPETRELAIATSERLGYRTSKLARALRSSRSFGIGVLIADVANPSSAEFVRGVEDVLTKEGSSMLLCNTDGDEQRQLAHMRNLLDHQVDGMVLISQHCDSQAVQAILHDSPPVVMVQRRDSQHDFDYVGANNYDGIVDAMRHSYALGHRRVGFISGPTASSSAQERLETFRQQSPRIGLDVSSDLHYQGEYTFDSGMAAAAYYLRMERLPTCILANSDVNALGVMQYLRDVGLSVPADISVVGLDDISLANFWGINLTTIHLCKRDIGAKAAELLLSRIANPNLPPRAEVLGTSLVIRGTTARAKAEGR